LGIDCKGIAEIRMNTAGQAKSQDGDGCGCGAEKQTASPPAASSEASCCGGEAATAHAHDAHAHHHEQHHGQAAYAADVKVLDLVCGMMVDPQTSKHRFDHRGSAYHFCSAGCRTKFAVAPQSYLDKSKAPPADVPEGTIYTCPMHPEVRRVGPGACPICGMALGA
jgi:Cu+-exporting ATPase